MTAFILLANFERTLFGLLLFFLSIFLILLVLVQRGRGGGLTGALGGPGGQSAFGTKAGDLFTKITSGVALVWISLCALAMLRIGSPPQRTAGDRGTAIAPRGPQPDPDELPPLQPGEDGLGGLTAPEELVPEDSQPEDSQPEDSQPEDSQPEDSQPGAAETRQDLLPADEQPMPEENSATDSQPSDPGEESPADQVPPDDATGGDDAAEDAQAEDAAGDETTNQP